MIKHGSQVAVSPRRPGDAMARSQWARWSDHLVEAADAQMPRAADAACAVAQAWRAAREGHCGLRLTAAAPQHAPR